MGQSYSHVFVEVEDVGGVDGACGAEEGAEVYY